MTDPIGCRCLACPEPVRKTKAALGQLTGGVFTVQVDAPPGRLLFLDRGVLLTAEGSEALEVLMEIEAAGTETLNCGTCLEFFDRREALQVGNASTLSATVETLTDGFPAVTVN